VTLGYENYCAGIFNSKVANGWALVAGGLSGSGYCANLVGKVGINKQDPWTSSMPSFDVGTDAHITGPLTIGTNGGNRMSHSLYGDLHLQDPVAGENIYGWLYSNEIINYGYAAIYGNLDVWGTKNFVQPHPTDSTKEIVYVAVESGEALTMVRGTAKTANGTAIVNLPEHFKLVTSDEAPVTAQITVKNIPAVLYVTKESREQIIVKVKSSDWTAFGDVEFNYCVQGVRDGFENHEPIQDVKAKESDAQAPTAKMSAKRAALQEKIEKAKARFLNSKKNSRQ
jgi:hypothetical protein